MTTIVQVPDSVLEKLTDEQLKETEHYAQISPQSFDDFLGIIDTSNPGLWYVLLDGHFKYNLVQDNPHVTEQDCEQFLIWSISHPDVVRRLFMNPSQVGIALADQTASFAFAMLQRKDATEKFASFLVENIIANFFIEGCEDREEAINLIGHVAFDKWSPYEYNNNVRRVIKEAFKSVKSPYSRRIRMKKEN